MKHANPEERHMLIAGLRDLADFLEARPEVPAPRWAEVFIFSLSTTDDEMKDEIDAVAALIGSSVDDGTAEHLNYVTTPTSARFNTAPSPSRQVATLTARRILAPPILTRMPN